MRYRLVLLFLSAIIPLAILAVLIFLGSYAEPVFRYSGLGFLGQVEWNIGNLYANPVTRHGVQVPIGAQYGILAFIVGTVLSSLIALILAVPISIGVAIFLSEGLSRPLRPWFSFILELLAGVPSVVYGLWGLVVLAPLILKAIGPFLSHLLGFIPFFAPPVSDYGLLTAALVLTLMITPFIAATLRDALSQVPQEHKEAAFALGADHFEVIRLAMLPAVRAPLIGAIFLGLGRALGETMAVLMVSGGAINYLPQNLYSPISTMASFILSQLDSAETDPTGMAIRALAAIALILFIISVLVNALARLLVYQGFRRQYARE
jgi:phosphate transport system permease protein